MASPYINEATGRILLSGSNIMLLASGSVYSDNFDSLIGNDYLVGQGSWIAGLNDIVVWDISGNNVVGPYTSSAYVSAIYNQALNNNQYVQVKMVTVTTDGRMGIGVRLTGSAATFCGYGFTISGTGNYCAIVKFTNGVATTIGATGTANASLNDVFKMTVVGSTITVYKNGSAFTSVGTNGVVTDATYSTGKAGLVGFGTYNDANADLFECGDL